MNFKRKKMLSRVTAALAAAAMAVGSVPLQAVAEEESYSEAAKAATPIEVKMSVKGPNGSVDPTVITANGHLKSGFYAVPVKFKTPRLKTDIEVTLTSRTKRGKQKFIVGMPDCGNTICKAGEGIPGGNSYTEDADGVCTHVMNVPVLGYWSQQNIIKTANDLTLHKLKPDEAPEMTFEDLTAAIETELKGFVIPETYDSYTAEAFKKVDETEQEALIEVINKPLVRVYSSDDPSSEPKQLTESEEAELIDAVTDMMTLGWAPSAGVAEGETLTVQLEALFNDNGNWVLSPKSEPVSVDVTLDNFGKEISNEPACEHDGEVKYEYSSYMFHEKKCAKCGKILEIGIPHTESGIQGYDSELHWDICTDCQHSFNEEKHTLSYKYDKDTHWQECSGCNYKSTAAAHEWEWEMDEDHVYIGQKCKCGAKRSDILGVIDLGKSIIVFPEGKDENSEFTKAEAEELGLRDEQNAVIDKDCYTISVETSKTDDVKWTVDFISVEDKSINKKSVEVTKACEHDGDVEYEYSSYMFHEKKCAKCGKILEIGIPHTASGIQGHDSELHWEICTDCQHSFNEEKHTLTYKYDKDTHWQECSGCDYKTEAEAHEYNWVLDEDGAYEDYRKCACGATKSLVGEAIDLFKTQPVFPEGKDENSDFTKNEAENLGLKDENDTVIGTDCYNIKVESGSTNDTLKVTFLSVEGKSYGKKETEVKKNDETFTVTVTYVLAEGVEKPEYFTETLSQPGLISGDVYDIPSPRYNGLAADKLSVSGVMGNSNVNVKVTYTKFVPGDADSNGTTNMQDYALLQRCLANWPVDINEANCDLNLDNTVNMQDYGLEQRLLAGWGIDLPA